MSGWVSVEEGLPRPNLKVLACRVGKTNHSAFFAVRRESVRTPWEFVDGDTCNTRITHWMLIPDVPKRSPK